MKRAAKRRLRILPRNPERGVILINVLAVVALTSAVIVAMITVQQEAVARSRDYSDAAQALAGARGGILSAVVALRRDAQETGAIDHAGEPWAALAETDAPIAGGTFSLSIRDAQGRFNINRLERGGALDAGVFRRIAAAAGLSPDMADRIVARIMVGGPIDSLASLVPIGVPGAGVAALSAYCTALPGATDININAAGEDLLAILLRNPPLAHAMISRRDRQGYLTPEDVTALRGLLPSNVGFTSDNFEVDVTVRIGETAQRLAALIQRRRENGALTVAPARVERRAAAQSPAPPR